MTLDEAQAAVDAYIGQFQVGYFDPVTQLVCLAEEQGELARELLHAHGPKPKKQTDDGGSAAKELGDVLFVLICLANSLGISLEEVLRASLDKYQARDQHRWERRDKDAETGAGGT